MYELMMVHEKQAKKVIEYLTLADLEPVDSDAPMDEFERKTIQFLHILEIFGNCPKAAAAARNEAKQKASQARDKMIEKMLAHIPNPTNEHYYASFATLDEAEAYWATVEEKANMAYSDVMNKEFYDIYFHYTDAQLQLPKTLH